MSVTHRAGSNSAVAPVVASVVLTFTDTHSNSHTHINRYVRLDYIVLRTCVRKRPPTKMFHRLTYWYTQLTDLKISIA